MGEFTIVEVTEELIRDMLGAAQINAGHTGGLALLPGNLGDAHKINRQVIDTV